MIFSLCFILGVIKSVAISFSQVYFMLKNLLVALRVIFFFFILPLHGCLHSQIDALSVDLAVSLGFSLLGSAQSF
jgi:hypothetical protein